MARSHPSPDNSPLVLVFVADDNYAAPLAATLYSALVNLSRPSQVEVFLVHGPMANETKGRLRALADRTRHDVTMHFIPVREDAALGRWSLQLESVWTPTTFFRLLIETLIPSTYSRVLYLDCDMIVEGDLLELWATDLEGKTVAAAAERSVSCPKFGIARWRELGLGPTAPYFNAGLMLIDLDRWRARHYGERVLDYLHAHGDTLRIKGNQEGLNAVLAGDWTMLDPVWNVLNWYYDVRWFDSARYGPVPSRRDRPRILRNAKVIHFTTRFKPWRAECDHPRRRRYFHYLGRSGWMQPGPYVRWRLSLEWDQLRYRARRALRARSIPFLSSRVADPLGV
jgi:lipopolysaccharide biosynthesis glycosyltransferase